MSNQLRLAVITGAFPPLPCGIGDYTARLIQSLQELGNITFQIFTSETPRKENEDLVIAVSKNWNWRDIGKILKQIRSEDLNLLHIQYPSGYYGRHPAINFLPLLIRLQNVLRRKKPTFCILTLHEYTTFKLLGKLRIWFTALSCHTIISVSPTTLHFLRPLNHLGKKLKFIPVGSNIGAKPPLEFQSSPNQWQRRHNLPENGPVIVYFGYLSPNKGLHILIQALQQLSQPFRLLLIAEPVMQEGQNFQAYVRELLALIKQEGLDEKIQWTGYATDEEVAAYLQSATIAVFPFTDGVSLRRTSLQAALLNGVATISTFPNKAEEGGELKSGENIWLVPPNNTEALKTAIAKLLSEPELRQKLAKNALAFAQTFSWSDIAAQHLKLYKTFQR
jgi:glycosyltransferase involved in cell wall biosynthesis